MASSPEKHLSCPICREVYKEPVLLSCSHSFCELCLRSWWREKRTKQCPVCKRRSTKNDPPKNLVLKQLSEAYRFLQQREHPAAEMCPLHSETFKLFCLSDQQPVCVVCRDAKAHEDHRFRPIVEAAQELREELDQALLPLKEHLQKTKGVKRKYELFVCRIKYQFNQTEKQICEEFKKLHQFLEEEEEARLKALKEEEEQKIQRMKDEIVAVSREIEVLSETIRDTEKLLRAADVSFLLKYKATVERVQHCPLLEEPQLGPGALMDQAKHLGNLAFNIWSKMKSLVHYSPVILDPNRSTNEIVLLDDLTSFTTEKQRRPNEAETDMSWNVVLGSEGFDCGLHSWDVEVGNSDTWGLGVKLDQWEGGGTSKRPDMWSLIYSDGTYRARHCPRQIKILLIPESNPRRVRVRLDCNEHNMSFYDLDANTLIHTFTKISPRKLYPIFLTRRMTKCKIRILTLDLQTIKLPRQERDEEREKKRQPLDSLSTWYTYFFTSDS